MPRPRRMEARTAEATSRGIRTAPGAVATGVVAAAVVGAAVMIGPRAIRMRRRRRVRRARASAEGAGVKETSSYANAVRDRRVSPDRKAKRPPVAAAANRVPREIVRRARAAMRAVASRAVAIAIVVAAVVADAGGREAVRAAARPRADRTVVAVAAPIRAGVRTAAVAARARAAAARAAAGETLAAPAAARLAGSNRLLARADGRDRREIREGRVVLLLVPGGAAVGQHDHAEIPRVRVTHG